MPPKKTIRRLKPITKPLKNSKILLPLTSEQKQEWQQRAKDAGYKSLTVFIRDFIDKGKISIQKPAPPVNEATFIELHKIGVNLNQAIRLLHIIVNSGVIIPDDTIHSIEELQSIINVLRLKVLGLSNTIDDT